MTKNLNNSISSSIEKIKECIKDLSLNEGTKYLI